jgi:hypothetical protein
MEPRWIRFGEVAPEKQPMALWLTSCLMAGLILGLGWRVHALWLVCIGVVVGGIVGAFSAGLVSAALAIGFGIALLQTAYLAGTIIYAMAVGHRFRADPDAARP